MEGALDLLSDLRARGVVPICFEQPVPDHHHAALEDVARRASIHVVADESVSCAFHVNAAPRSTARRTR